MLMLSRLICENIKNASQVKSVLTETQTETETETDVFPTHDERGAASLSRAVTTMVETIRPLQIER